jgi:hypothetical protein
LQRLGLFLGDGPLSRLDRVLPRPKDAAVSIGLLQMRTPEELLQAQEGVMQELALGQLTPNQAEQIFSLIEARRRLLETQELEQRLRAIEKRMLGGEPDKAA